MALSCTGGEITLQEIVDGVNTNETNLTDHEGNFSNPHLLSHSQLAEQTKDDHHSEIHAHNGADGSGTVYHDSLINSGINTHSEIDSHITDISNPHKVTAVQVGAATSSHQHSAYSRDFPVYSGATVFSDIKVTNGIITAVASRELTPADIGAEVACISGSNGNGNYYKFDDGMMVCLGPASGITANPANSATGSLFYSAAKVWTYPAAFIAYGIAVTCGLDNKASWVSVDTDNSLVSADFQTWAASSQANGRIMYPVAIGRWK